MKYIYCRWKDLLNAAYRLVCQCVCEDGCPSCCHNPNCTDYNEHLSKNMAILILASLLGNNITCSIAEDKSSLPTHKSELVESNAKVRRSSKRRGSLKDKKKS